MKQALILFTRVPAAGKTKTRLLRALSPAECARAHGAFLRDEVENCRGARWEILIFHGNEAPVSALKTILPDQNCFFPQTGETLGEKMEHAIRETLGMGYDRCVLVGADLPELSGTRIAAAFDALKSADLVLGGTPDGGYYLIGCKSPCPAVFDGQQYGGSSVFENTLRAAEAAGLSVKTVPPLHDIDEPSDLRALANRLEQTPDACPHTRKFLQELGWMKGRSEF